MIYLDKQNQFYPRCIFRQLMGMSNAERIGLLKEIPHEELKLLRKSLEHERSIHPHSSYHHFTERISLVEQAIDVAYGDTYSEDECWKTWWVLPD